MKKLPYLFALAGLLVSGSAFSNIEEIVITGELRETSALSLANSVSVISEELISQRETQQLEDLLNLAPNVNYSAGASRGRFIQIRGIGERSQFVAPINPSVGVIVDGIDMTGISAGVTAIDTQQVEIFRGPQGTLYGANALAGLINVRGNRVGDELEASVGATIGDYDRLDLNTMISTPVSEHIGWRFSAQQSKQDGFIENDFLNRSDTNNIDEISFRNLFSFDINENASLDLVTYYIDTDNGYDAFSLDNNRITLSDQPGTDAQDTVANALHFDYQGWNAFDLNAVVSHASSDITYGYDEDWSFREICAETDPCAYYQYSTTDLYERDNDNTTADIRLLSKGDSALDWVIGVYQRNQTVDLTNTYTNNDPNYDSFYGPITSAEVSVYTSDYETENTALYAQLDVQLTDQLTLSGGLRSESYSADFTDSNNAEFDPEEDLIGGKISLEYQANENTLIYGLVSRGYKVGGFNPDDSLEEDELTFDTESMINYEFGTKGLWLDGTLQAQIALFYQDRDDIQVKQSLTVLDDGAFEFIDFIDNAAEGVNYGLEAEVVWQASEQLSLFANLGLLETEYQDFINNSHVDRITDAVTDELIEGVDMSGRDQAHAPNYQFFTGAEWSPSEAYSLRLELEGKDSFYFSSSHDEQSEAYVLANLRAEYRLENTSFALWMKNVTDETVETRGFYFSNDFGNDPRKFYAAEPYTQKGAPRTLGLSVQHNF